ncbi:MAG: MFS transporter [Chloroflexota bacterium]
MGGVVAAYRRLLGNGPLTRLLLGEFVSSIGDWLYLVALLIIIYQRTEDAVILGIVGAARILPYVFLSVPAGIIADRYDRRMVLMVTDLGRAALMLVLAWLVAVDGPIELIVGVTVLATCLSTFFGPAIGAYIPNLVKDEADLGPANTVYASLDNIAYVVGPAVAAVILGLSSQLAIAFVLNAVTFLVIAAILWRLPVSRVGMHARTDDDGTPASTPSFDLRAVRRPVAGLVVFESVGNLVFGGLGVLTVVIAYDLLRGGEAATGALNSAMGVGGLLGAVVAGILVLRRRLAPPLLLGAATLALGLLILGWSASLSVSLVAMALAAGGALLGSVVGETLFQRVVPDEVRGRALGFLNTVNVLMYAAGSLLMAAAAQVWGITPVLFVSGVAILVAAGVSMVLLGPWATQVPQGDPRKHVLTQVGIFSGLPPARLEAAEARAVLVPMAGGEVIIRQGDPADRFYVIQEGTVEVTQATADGTSTRLRSLGVGDAFGEIGLLTGSPRTATVTATSKGTLVALGGDAFLELVNGTGITFPFLEIHRGQAPSAA